MKTSRLSLLVLFAGSLPAVAAGNQVLGWNNLGMHCMDSDYSVFSILPPYNTIQAQLIIGGKLLTNGSGYSVRYEAVADPEGSINRTAVDKGNFSQYDQALYGVDLAPEMGLAGWAMPGTNNSPQPMSFEVTNTPAAGVHVRVNWFRAEGIPITPWDDAGKKNPYPLMRLIARSGSTPVATNDIVLPVSDEMDCRACHASGTVQDAQPAAGWVWSSDPERDYRLNILRLHDEHQFALDAVFYGEALAARGFNPLGLYRGVVADGKPVLCAVCHASEALGTGSYEHVPPLTASIHSLHASVYDPDLSIRLDNSTHRAACYRCHPGSATKCLRGAMGSAIAADGTMEIHCQSCHGNMSAVGSSSRVGWFMEPNCQSCHTGNALTNNGQIRFTSSFELTGEARVATNLTFATTPNTPAAGLSLYRFSSGHGGLQCSACHGSTHAEFPATHRNDNLRNERIQGHAGVTVDCTTCHTTAPNTVTGGPHGMHPNTQDFVTGHGDLMELGGATRQQCRICHGSDYTGTVLSRSQRTITFATKYGDRTYWRGKTVSCYDCHDGASSSDPALNTPPNVASVATNTFSGEPVTMLLAGSDPNGNLLSFRVVSQPTHGSAALSDNTLTYFPEPGYVGTDQFTFAASDSWSESNLGTGSVAVAQGAFSISARALVPPSYPALWPAPFGATAVPVNVLAAPNLEWDFGDGSPRSTDPYATHTYTQPGSYQWNVTARVSNGTSTVTTNLQGNIIVGQPVRLVATHSGGFIVLSWPRTNADALLEETTSLSSPNTWSVCTNAVSGESMLSVTVAKSGTKFYRLRKL